MKSALFIGILLILLGCTPSPEYVHSVKLDLNVSKKCTKARRDTFSFSDYEFEKECMGRSAEFDVFIVERDGDEYIANVTDPKSSSYQFDKKSNFSMEGYGGEALGKNKKYRVRGVFESRSYSSGANFYLTSASEVVLTHGEQEKRAAKKAYEEVLRFEKQGWVAYLHCADRAMAKMNFTVECPKPESYSSARLGEDGSILIRGGMCFMGKSTVLFDCKYANGSAIIEKTQIIGG